MPHGARPLRPAGLALRTTQTQALLKVCQVPIHTSCIVMGIRLGHVLKTTSLFMMVITGKALQRGISLALMIGNSQIVTTNGLANTMATMQKTFRQVEQPSLLQTRSTTLKTIGLPSSMVPSGRVPPQGTFY